MTAIVENHKNLLKIILFHKLLWSARLYENQYSCEKL